jgi:hypothetical protein
MELVMVPCCYISLRMYVQSRRQFYLDFARHVTVVVRDGMVMSWSSSNLES